MRKIRNGFYIIAVTSLLVFGCGKSDNRTESKPPEIGVAGDGNLTEILDYIRNESDVPAISAIMYKNGEIVEMAAVGTTKKGGSEAVSIKSKWHIGSITKSMTSTLAGVFVENGLIGWDSTIIEIFPEYSDVILDKYHDIQLDELLSHSSGIGYMEIFDRYDRKSSITDQRIELLKDALAIDFGLERGEMFYSNPGYTIAGAMLERVGEASWEELITEHLFLPLGMNDTGFLAPTDIGSPWGHSDDKNETPLDPNDITSDNPAVWGPSGLVHSTLEDMAKYIGLHLDKGETGSFLKPSTFDKLHKSVVKHDPEIKYALGWYVNTDKNFMFHTGSNGKWYSMLMIHPDRNYGMFIVTNIRGSKGQEASSIVAIDYMLKREEALDD